MMIPLQPLYRDFAGTIRFRKNAMIDRLMWAANLDQKVVDKAAVGVTLDDRAQMAMLMGCSLADFRSQEYVSDELYARAEQAAIDAGLIPQPDPIESLAMALDDTNDSDTAWEGDDR